MAPLKPRTWIGVAITGAVVALGLGALVVLRQERRKEQVGAGAPRESAAGAREPGSELETVERARLEIQPRAGAVPRAGGAEAPDRGEPGGPDAVAGPRLRIEVLDPDGRPAPETQVICKLLDLGPEDGAYRPRRTRSARTDADGRAAVALTTADQAHPWLEVWALHGERGLVSEAHWLRTPWPLDGEEPLVLRLRAGGSLRVRVFDASLQAAVGAEVRMMSVRSIGHLMRESFWRTMTGTGGDVVLPALRPGEYEVLAGDERIGRSARDRVRVEWAEEARLELVLSDSSLAQAVAGTLVDEDGAPLSEVQIGVTIDPVGDDSDGEYWVRTDVNGRFAWFAEAGARVSVRPGPNDACTLFEPETITVAFGTHDVALRRNATSAPVTLTLRAIDAATGRPIEGARAWIVYAEKQNYFDCSSELSGPDGLASVSACLRRGCSFGVRAPGYVDAEGGLLGTQLSPGTRTTELRPGFDRRLRIAHWYDDRPLPGAVVTDGGGIRAVTDAEGLVHLTGRVWPERLEVRCEGYETVAWDPRQRGGWGIETMGLTPVEGEQD